MSETFWESILESAERSLLLSRIALAISCAALVLTVANAVWELWKLYCKKLKR